MRGLIRLLSNAWVAYAIEWDNAVELATAHKTTDHGGRGLWLTSMAMWHNCLRYVPPEGITAKALAEQAGLPTNLDGVRRWGYVTLETTGGSKSNPLLRLRSAAKEASETWRSTFAEIDRRWEARFHLAELRSALHESNAGLDPDLPDCLPILGHGLAAAGSIGRRKAQSQESLDVLLAKPLLAFAKEYEQPGLLSCAMLANALQWIPEQGIEVRRLPQVSGVSKEAIAMALSFLSKRGYVSLDSANGRKTVARTSAGEHAAREAERSWKESLERFDAQASARLAAALMPLCQDGTAGESPLFQGLKPQSGNWRSKVPAPFRLPDFPMVLHRGGYPDGS